MQDGVELAHRHRQVGSGPCGACQARFSQKLTGNLVMSSARAGAAQVAREAEQAVAQARGEAQQAVAQVAQEAEQAVAHARGEAQQAVAQARAAAGDLPAPP